MIPRYVVARRRNIHGGRYMVIKSSVLIECDDKQGFVPLR
jgi:hypothetical protein